VAEQMFSGAAWGECKADFITDRTEAGTVPSAVDTEVEQTLGEGLAVEAVVLAVEAVKVAMEAIKVVISINDHMSF